VDSDYEYISNFIYSNEFAFEIKTTKISEAQVAAQITEIIRR